MTEAELRRTIIDLVAEAVEQPSTSLSEQSCFETLPRWTSFISLLVLTRIEERTGVRLDLRAYLNGRTVGDLQGMVVAASR
jgi:acyl carrier protein